ncbi:MAG: rRNA maturation RNase YbeY [Acidimicrobiaceae bacterium]|nr:rRNA maturation RNase YbeY [Acidimicrobiaceae bacterium]
MNDAAGPVVVVLDEQRDVEIDTECWHRLASGALVSSGVMSGELNLIFVDEAAMTRLNRRHMGKRYATDVLSFPLDGSPSVDSITPEFGETLIGDVVVCPARAAAQARDHEGQRGHDGSLEDELALLIVHGVLHVLGHDHYDTATTDRMQSCEQALLRQHHRA